MAHGATNLGLKDILLAFEWVQKNIAAFGGEPSKVRASSLIHIGVRKSERRLVPHRLQDLEKVQARLLWAF